MMKVPQEVLRTAAAALPAITESPSRKRTASEAAPGDVVLAHPAASRLSPPRIKYRKASMAEPIRARDERDEMEEEMDTADFDGSATEYSTDARR